ncbi:MAG: DNA topoisomerase VI subunit B, partial [Desulfurococcaceae archaeon]
IYKEIAKLYPKIRPPSPKALSPLGEDIIEAGLKKIFNPDFVKAVSRKPRVYQGHPFIVEAAVAYGGGIPSSSEPTLLRYANKIPLLYDEKADVSWKVIEKISWEQYNIVMPAPLIILTHVCSTKVPFKGVGKESIADVPEVERELGLAIKEALRALRDHLVRRMKEELAKRKALTLIKYVPEVAINLSKIAGGDGVRRLIEDKLVEIIARKTSIDASYLKEIVKKVKIGI